MSLINLTLFNHYGNKYSAEILTELKQVKKELAELKGKKIDRPVVSKTKYPHMNIILPHNS